MLSKPSSVLRLTIRPNRPLPVILNSEAESLSQAFATVKPTEKHQRVADQHVHTAFL
jgi:hypothetical protein